MSTRDDYTTDDWRAIVTAPAAAGLMIASVNGRHAFGEGNDASAVGWAVLRSTHGDAPEIARVLAEGVQRLGSCAELPEIAADDFTRQMESLVAIVARAVRAVESTSPAEIQPFKAWLASVAAKLFHLAKAARIAPTDAALISREEQEAIDRLASVLGVSTSRGAGGAVHHVGRLPAITAHAAHLREQTSVTPPAALPAAARKRDGVGGN